MATVADMLAQMAQPTPAGRNPTPDASIGDEAPTGPNPFDRIDPPKPAAKGPRTVADLLGLGVRDVMTGAGGLVDVVAGPANATVNAVTGSHLSTTPGRDLANAAANAAGLEKPQNEQDRLAQAIIEGGTQGLGTAGVGGAVSGAEGAVGTVGRALAAHPLVDTALAAESGGASETVRQHGGGPIAQIAAGLATPIATHVAVSAAPVAVRAAAQAAEPLTSAVSHGAAENAAGRVIASRATDASATAAALEQPGELVPGSQPTTFQQTGDMGLGSLEREVAAKNPAAFNARRADQNAARVQALGEVQQGADPNDVAKTLRSNFDALDTQTQADVDQAHHVAQQRTAAIGGEGTPDSYGAAIRNAEQDALDAAHERDSALWRAVDPNGDQTANVTHTLQSADEIAGSVPTTARPMEGEEAAIFDAARNMQPLSPLSDLIALRTRVNDAMRAERGPQGNAQAYRRLVQLRQAIQTNLSTTIAQQIAADDAAVARGAMAAQDSTLSRVQNWADEWQSERRAGGYTDGSNALSREPTAFGPGADGTGLPSPWRSGGIARDQGLAGGNGASQEVTQPSVDEGTQARLEAATAATKETKQTHGVEPLRAVMRDNGTKGQYVLPTGDVARKFFHPGASSFDHIQALIKAAGENVIPTLVDYAAASLRRAALREDGTLDPGKFATWKRAYTDGLRALPEDAQAKFADAAAAGKTLADAKAARVTALKEAQAGAIGKVMGLTEKADVVRTIGQILNGRTAVADMKRLALATRGDPEARAGLRQAVADYMSGKLLGNTEAGTSGVSTIKGDAYQTFIKQARPALHLIFSPEEVGTMEAIAEDIQRSNRSLNAVKLPGGSNTAQDLLGATKGKGLSLGKSMLDLVGMVVGGMHGGAHGAILGGMATHLIQALHGAGVARVDQLVTEAMLNPKLARELLKKAPKKPSSVAFRPIVAALAIPATASQARAKAQR